MSRGSYARCADDMGPRRVRLSGVFPARVGCALVYPASKETYRAFPEKPEKWSRFYLSYIAVLRKKTARAQ